MATPIAIVTGDWHYHIWKQFNENNRRTLNTESFILDLFVRAQTLKVPILFDGDMYHTPKGLSTELICRSSIFWERIVGDFNVRLIGISGNHDLDQINYEDHRANSLFAATVINYPSFMRCIDFDMICVGDLMIFGIPYLTHNIGLKKLIERFSSLAENSKATTILLLHTDMPGALDTNGREIGEHTGIPRNMGEFFKAFDFVFSGHIHKQQMLWENKVFMVGAPYQQRKSDSECKMGYHILYDNGMVGFTPTNYPRFRYYNEDEEPENNTDFWIMVPKPKRLKNKEITKFANITNRDTLAKEYIKQKGIKSIPKTNALIEILNKIDD